MELGSTFWMSVILSVVITLTTVGAFRYPNLLEDDMDLRSRHSHSLEDDQALLETLLLKRSGRNQQCVGGGAECFSSLQCCNGFVCAAFNVGQNPEIPGFCLKEKDLTLCVVSSDCDVKSMCLALGRTGQKYCVAATNLQVVRPSHHAMPSRRVQDPTKSNGGLGSTCDESSDCNTETDDGSPLCCQDVTRHRQGVRRMCSRVISISKCIVSAD